MKLEMVTIIACEVDTEVFTSDKMQVRFFTKMRHAANHDFALVVGLCSSLLWSQLTACWPVDVYAYVGDVECSSLADEDFYQWEPQLAKTHVSRRAHGTVTDAGWIAEMGR